MATVARKMKSRWRIYHFHVFRVILIGFKFHFMFYHVNHRETTCIHVLTWPLFKMLPLPSCLKTDTFSGHIVELSLEINLFSSYKIVPTLQPASYFQHSPTFISFYLMSHFVSIVASWDTINNFDLEKPLNCVLLYPNMGCDNCKHAPHYTVVIFQKILFE